MHKPQIVKGRSPQTEAIISTFRELDYGGACGGGKSDLLAMAGLQYCHYPGYNAIIFRKQFTDLSLADCLIPRITEWLQPWIDKKQVHWDQMNHVFKFPSGATLGFGHLESAGAEFRYKGAAFNFIGFDQVEEIPENQYMFLHSRARRHVDCPIPTRIWSTSNPDGLEWVKERFLPWFICPDCGLKEKTSDLHRSACTKCGSQDGYVEFCRDENGDKIGFIPAYLDDNAYLDRDDYTKGLSNLDPVRREQLLRGDWNVKNYYMFRRSWIHIISPEEAKRKYAEALTVSIWDFAATEEGKASDPDYTANCKMAFAYGRACILRMIHKRLSPYQIEEAVRETLKEDALNVINGIEEEKGAAGKNLVDQYRRNVFRGRVVDGETPTGSKSVRAMALASAAQAGNVEIVEAPWNNEFLSELEGFPIAKHDDQVDVAAYSYNKLTSEALSEVAMVADT